MKVPINIYNNVSLVNVGYDVNVNGCFNDEHSKNVLKVLVDTVKICDNETFYELFNSKYALWLTKGLKQTFIPYFEKRRESVIKVYTAMLKEYDITENYDKHSTLTNDTSEIENKTYSATFDGETKETDKNELSYKNKPSIDGISHNTINTEYTHGNIGVTTNSQMITGEIELRLKDMLEKIVDNFIHENGFLNMGVYD